MKTNTTLRFLHEVLKLEYLHYGLWNGEEPTREGLIRAQLRFAETLMDWIPEGVGSILDVGAGVGTMSRELAERGFEVEGLSPDPYQAEVFVERTGKPFHLARFEDFAPGRAYDLVLMSESAQYVPLAGLFEAACRVGSGGYLLVADYFVVDTDDSIDHPAVRSGHRLADFYRAAELEGLEIVRQREITEDVIPTLELLSDWIDGYVEPSLVVGGESLGRRYPRIAKLAMGRLLRGLDKHRTAVSPDLFRRLKCYLILLFRIPSAPTTIRSPRSISHRP